VILIAYDGSDDAKAAIEGAGRLFPGQDATVVTVWQHFVDTMARFGGGVAVVVDYDEIDASSAEMAGEKAGEGVALARNAGLAAVAATAVVATTVSAAILDKADEIDATAVVLGSRGFTGVKSLMLGSVSHHVVQHADRPVVVIPSPAVVAARRAHHDSLK